MIQMMIYLQMTCPMCACFDILEQGWSSIRPLHEIYPMGIPQCGYYGLLQHCTMIVVTVQNPAPPLAQDCQAENRSHIGQIIYRQIVYRQIIQIPTCRYDKLCRIYAAQIQPRRQVLHHADNTAPTRQKQNTTYSRACRLRLHLPQTIYINVK